MSLIPDSPKKATQSPPNFVVIIGPPKIGTTECCLQLPNCLHVDLQEGATQFSGNAQSVNIVNIVRTARVPDKDEYNNPIKRLMKGRYEAVKYLLDELEKNKIAGKPMFDFIVLDPAASLEEIAEERALELYYKSAYKSSDPKDSTKYVKFDVGWNKGMEMLQKAFEEIIFEFKKYTPTLILKVHGKDTISTNLGKEVTMETLDLTKGISGWLAKECDTICTMYRVENNVNRLSFVKTPTNILLGARAKHLNNKIIDISKMDEHGVLHTYWESVFPHIKAKKESVKAESKEEAKPISQPVKQ